MTRLRTRFLRAARWGVWLLIAWLVVRGVASVVAPPAPVQTIQLEPAPKSPIDTEGARAFATLFAREYLTWEPNGVSARATRLAPFLTTAVDAGGGFSLKDQESSQTVADARPWGLTVLTDQRAQVTVVSEVVTAGPGQEPVQKRRVALVVPVALVEGGFLVYDYPTFVPLQRAGEWQGEAHPGTPVAEAVPAVRDLLSGFLRAYVQGTQAELSYFLVPGARLTGLQSQFLFRDLKEVEVLRQGEQHWAVAEALLEDPAAGATYRQRFLVKLSQQDRWYVEDIQEKGVWTQ